MSLQRIRGRLPLVVFLFLALLLAMLAGFACACLTDHPMQALERAVAQLAAVPAVVEVWSLVAFGLASALLVATARRSAPPRTSPALLQRFLF